MFLNNLKVIFAMTIISMMVNGAQAYTGSLSLDCGDQNGSTVKGQIKNGRGTFTLKLLTPDGLVSIRRSTNAESYKHGSLTSFRLNPWEAKYPAPEVQYTLILPKNLPQHGPVELHIMGATPGTDWEVQGHSFDMSCQAE